MTPSQFTALAELLRLRGGPAQECARLVLVDGQKIKAAGEATGLAYRKAAEAVQRVREGRDLARQAVAEPVKNQ